MTTATLLFCSILQSATATQASAIDLETGLLGPDYWGGIPRHPAVVNSVGREKDDTWLSLAGEWAFTNFNHGSGRRTTAFKNQEVWPLTRPMKVPGCWEAQGLGGEGMGVPHLCQDNSPRMLRGTFKGEGYYRRTVEIPSAWAGRRVWLKVGGVRSRGWFYVNNHAVAQVDAYAGAWKYEITPFVTPGETAKVVVVCDNVVAARNGQPSTSQRWGGITRDLEIEATPETFIDDAWVRGDFDRRVAEVKVRVEVKDDAIRLRATIDGETKEVPLSTATADYALDLALREFRPWSPETPNLYWATIELVKDGQVLQTRRERFGVRKLEVRGTRFYLNNRPFFFRGFGDDGTYPITGMTPPSRELHLRHMMQARACGFNYVRLHTHCETPEYFEAADEAGIFIQPELSYYLDEPDDYFGYDPVRDAVERFITYRRYPSYAINSSGNEGMLGPGAGKILYGILKKMDPDRLVIEEDMGFAEVLKNGLSNDGRTDFYGGPLNTWLCGSYKPDRPFVCHEYMNLTVKQDSRSEDLYAGVWMPTETRAHRAKWLAKFGLTHLWGDRLQDAQHALQKLWQKDGLEHARRDPYCAGYCYWTISDCAVYSEKIDATTAQGLFDPFWQVKKGGAAPADFAVFNSPSCILLSTQKEPPAVTPSPLPANDWWMPGAPAETNRVFASGETIPLEFLLAHYGEKDLAEATFAWSLATAEGAALTSGAAEVGDWTAQPVKTILKTSFVVPTVERPTKVVLTATIRAKGQTLANAWPFWFFPKAPRRALSPRTVVCAPDSPEAAKARAAGRNLILVSNQTGPANHRLGWWWIGSQAGTAFATHPAWGDFPYEPTLAPLHFRLIREGAKLPVAGFTEGDFLAVGEGGEAAYLYLAAKTRPDNGREVFVSGLDITSDTPEAISLFNNLARWVENL